MECFDFQEDFTATRAELDITEKALAYSAIGGAVNEVFHTHSKHVRMDDRDGSKLLELHAVVQGEIVAGVAVRQYHANDQQTEITMQNRTTQGGGRLMTYRADGRSRQVTRTDGFSMGLTLDIDEHEDGAPNEDDFEDEDQAAYVVDALSDPVNQAVLENETANLQLAQSFGLNVQPIGLPEARGVAKLLRASRPVNEGRG